jgi:hypothetical protein
MGWEGFVVAFTNCVSLLPTSPNWKARLARTGRASRYAAGSGAVAYSLIGVRTTLVQVQRTLDIEIRA